MMEPGCQIIYHLTTALKEWSRARCPLVFLAVILAISGCSEGAKLVRADDSGGLATYPFKGETGYLFSPFREDALALLRQRCPQGYTVVREGETQGRSRLVENAAGLEMITERRWGLEFRCT